jgi:N-acetylglucosaminyldiphosphoundecaprenol N-acetyl-beta-D-mannosaminyltransferase
VVLARDDARHMQALRTADMVVPDGMPLVWIARLRGRSHMRRVCGPDLLRAVCARSVGAGWRHYFFGGAPGVADQLAQRLAERHPGLQVAGTDAPPFRPPTPQELDRALERMRAARPDIVWIGLGCPRQEQWMLENRARLPGTVLIGVGAAFDFETGRVRRAPPWMQKHGLEWLHRLVSEPRRLWRRYLILGPRFAVGSLVEAAGMALRAGSERTVRSARGTRT